MKHVLDHQQAAQVHAVRDVQAVVGPPVDEQPRDREECPQRQPLRGGRDGPHQRVAEDQERDTQSEREHFCHIEKDEQGKLSARRLWKIGRGAPKSPKGAVGARHERNCAKHERYGQPFEPALPCSHANDVSLRCHDFPPSVIEAAIHERTGIAPTLLGQFTRRVHR